MNTVMIHGSDEELVQFGTLGTFIRGKRVCVIITGIGKDPNTPQVVKEELVGLPVDAVLTREQVVSQGGGGLANVLPEGCLLAYASEVIDMLRCANRFGAMGALKRIAPNPLDMYILESGTFEVVKGQ